MEPRLYFVACGFLLFLFSAASRSSAATLSGRDTERLALLEFKRMIAEDPSRVLNSWNDNTTLCDWNGVTCSGGGDVVTLNLSSLGLSGLLSPSVSNLTNLKILQLSGNDFSGEIPPAIGTLNRLEVLDLSLNSFIGVIPGSLTNCSELVELDLGGNHLTGEIPAAIGSISKLEKMSLVNNSLIGEIPTSITNLTNLKLIGLMLNNLRGLIPEQIGNLQLLQVFQASANNLSGEIPSQLFNISYLWYLAVSDNCIYGTLPADIGSQLPNLQTLILGENVLRGGIPSSLSNASGLQMISVSYNYLSGSVPSSLGTLAGLTYLDLQSNALDNDYNWEYLYALTNCSQLQNLYLSGNFLKGDLPNSMANLSPQLQELFMSGNQITGVIPVGIGNLTNLQVLSMGDNSLAGAIPDSFAKLQALQEVYLSHNNLTGLLPSSLANLSRLSDVFLELNDFEGPIPPELGDLQHLTNLYLSDNRLNQEIPKEIFIIFTLQYLCLDNNLLSGSIPAEVGNNQNLQAFVVSRNNLSGEIPATVGNCLVLEVLDLSSNSITGATPQSLGNLKGLQYLNLSHNGLSGLIPATLGNLPALSSLDLSFNRLNGEVPLLGVFQNSSAIEVAGNDGLCGGIAELNLSPCSSSSSPPTSSPRKNPSSSKTLITGSLAAFCFLWFVLCLSFYAWWSQRPYVVEKQFMHSSENYYPIVSYAELSRATERFSPANLIGAGAHGAVYRGVLGSKKTMVAIKVFDLISRGASKTFETERLTLRSIRHRNLVKILTTCSGIDSEGKDFKALVYELIPGGSLEAWLHDHVGEKSLSFFQRLNIAVDIADALNYLHNCCHFPIAHCDLKPSNVLLDCQMTARLTDFGLARFLEDKSADGSVGIRGTVGYIAPEFGSGGRASTRSDVYSYGILVLEMFTGRRPVDEMFKDGMNLRCYVEAALPARAIEVVDPRLSENEHETNIIGDDFFVSVLTVGFLCSSHRPGERMRIREAAARMNDVKKAYILKSSEAEDGGGEREGRRSLHGDNRGSSSPSNHGSQTLIFVPEVLRELGLN